MRNRLTVLVFLVGLAGTSAAEEPQLTSANGVALPVPEIGKLTCDRIQNLLFRYQDSGYRPAGTIPRQGPDVALFKYEDALARRNYETCLPDAYGFANPTPAFANGFN